MARDVSGAVVLERVALGYRDRPAVVDLTGAFAQGSLTAVCGPNGSGKSTLLKGIAGFLQPMRGEIRREGLRRRDIAYLPQASEVDRSFPINVFDFIAMGCVNVDGMFRRIAPSARTPIHAAIAVAGLQGCERRAIGELSGGQMQRALFARLMLQNARFILLDEPFSGIDEASAHDLLSFIATWRAEGRTVVAVLHNIALVREIFPQTLLLARRCVAWGPTETALTAENLRIARQMRLNAPRAEGLWADFDV